METSELRELEPAAEWRAVDVADQESWTLRLTEADHAELHAALATAKKKSTDPLELGRDGLPARRPGRQARRRRDRPSSTAAASCASRPSTPIATATTT